MIVLEDAMRSAACDAVCAAANVGGPGFTDICQGATVLAVYTFPSVAFLAAVNGVATANALPRNSAPAIAAGTADNYKVRDNGGNLLWSGSVTAIAGGGDMELTSPAMVIGQIVGITNWTHTQPA